MISLLTPSGLLERIAGDSGGEMGSDLDGGLGCPT